MRRRLFDALAASSRKALSLKDGPVVIKIDLRRPRRELAAFRTLRRARSLVIQRSRDTGGEPVFSGTRVPVHLVAKLVSAALAKVALEDGFGTMLVRGKGSVS